MGLHSLRFLPGEQQCRSRGRTGSTSGCGEEWLEKGLQGLQFFACPAKGESSCQRQDYLAFTNSWTKCASSDSHSGKSHPTLCILLYVNTQVCAYNGKEGSTHIDLDSVIKVKWVLILVPILVGTGILGAAAIGTSALIIGNQNFRELISQTDLDQGHLEILFMAWRAKLTPLPR